MFLPRLFLCVLASLALLAPRFAAGQIRADVQVSGGVNGTFTIDLEYVKTPMTVANFIGLATGQRPWIDYATGAIRKDPFYNGVTFHRVIETPTPFMSQTGSRKGDGTDGPGYSFKDEFDPTLRHDGAYVVSMANSGKHTNGSQFFITAAATAWLNDKHTVFGRVIAGQAILDAINATPTGAGDVPVTPIVIQSINVYGASLAGFNVLTGALPTAVDARPVLTKSGTTFTLGYDARTYSGYTRHRGNDLTTWTPFNTALPASHGGIAPSGTEDVTTFATGSRHFFRMARIDYGTTAARFIPASLGGRTFTFLNIFNVQVIFTFDAAGSGGTWNFPTSGSGTIDTVNYVPDRYTMQMYVRINSAANYGIDIQFLLTSDYTSANGGTFTGQTSYPGAGNVSGTFTTSP